MRFNTRLKTKFTPAKGFFILIHSRFLVLLMLCLSLFLTACPSTEDPEPTVRIPPVDAQGNVSVAAAQFVSLRSRMESGLPLATARNVNMSNLLAEDVYGEPFIYLVFVSPRPIDNLYTYGLTADSSKWEDAQNTLDDTPWSTHYIGASNIRDVDYATLLDLDYLVTLADTVQSLGGENNVARLVAFSPTGIVIETTSGTFVDPSNGRVLSESEVTMATETYNQLQQEIDDAGLLPLIRQGWLCAFDSSECGEPDPKLDTRGEPPYNFDVAALTQADGTLDIPTAANEIHRQLITP